MIGDTPLTSRERQIRLREVKRGTEVPEGTAHGIYAYRVYRCRCGICRAARSAEWVRKRNRWRAGARGHWHTELRNGVPTEVVHWPPVELDTPWLCPSCDYKIIPGEGAA